MGVSFEFYSREYNKDIIKDSKLSILLRTDSLSFLLRDPQTETLHLLRHFDLGKGSNTSQQEEVLQILSSDEVLTNSPKCAHLAIEEKAYTLIPSRLHNPEKASSYFLDFEVEAYALSYHTRALPDGHHHLAYAIEDQKLEWFKGFRIEHFQSAMEAQLKLYSLFSGDEDRNLFLDFHQDTFTICIIDRSKIIFLNTFDYAHTNDVLFYILKLCSTLKIKTREVRAYVSGLSESYSKIWKALDRYMGSLSLFDMNMFFAEMRYLGEDAPLYQDLLAVSQSHKS